MELLDALEVYWGSEKRTIELYQGDLTDLTPAEAVDILVVSAFPNDYVPTHTSLIGALFRKGVVVEELARHKASDLRGTFSCWLSEEVNAPNAGIQFRRILCFEPTERQGSPPAVVGDIFRALAPFLGDDPPMSTVAMPIVASGDMAFSVSQMLPPLLDAAIHWMILGLPLKRLKIVAHSKDRAAEASEIFAQLKAEHYRSKPPFETKQPNQYDVFVSYAREDQVAVDMMVGELEKLWPAARIFVDRLTLDVGAAWQSEIFEAMDASSRIMVVFSPAYLQSKVCKDEFNIAFYRSRDADEDLMFPVYLSSAALPTYMKIRSFADCREFDVPKLRSACAELASSFS